VAQIPNAERPSQSLTRKLTGIIDVHSHIILDLETGRDIGTGARIETPPAWSVDRDLSLMDAHGIASYVLSVPDAANILKALKLAKLQDVRMSICENRHAASKPPRRQGLQYRGAPWTALRRR